MLAITPDRQKALLIATGAAVGVAQTVLLKKFADGSAQAWMPSLPSWVGSFAKPSAFAGIIGGVAGVLVGLYFPLDPKLKNVAVAYGGGALASGLLSGLDLI
jgi:hypothetical protein